MRRRIFNLAAGISLGLSVAFLLLYLIADPVPSRWQTSPPATVQKPYGLLGKAGIEFGNSPDALWSRSEIFGPPKTSRHWGFGLYPLMGLRRSITFPVGAPVPIGPLRPGEFRETLFQTLFFVYRDL
ncbi:MAG: hypothetical protein NTW19_21205 [Planctomycetota bacterium]|nr:hypothetical protein [Planctomycetota bacterium]